MCSTTDRGQDREQIKVSHWASNPSITTVCLRRVHTAYCVLLGRWTSHHARAHHLGEVNGNHVWLLPEQLVLLAFGQTDEVVATIQCRALGLPLFGWVVGKLIAVSFLQTECTGVLLLNITCIVLEIRMFATRWSLSLHSVASTRNNLSVKAFFSPLRKAFLPISWKCVML